ncbi:MAG: GNAT family N-acetyltransferase [Lachnospiraceae bacterium]|nr:GNAT family N-acetyltransferase [Lachnospiraceae bacterium]
MEIREATALEAEKILEYCKVIGGESDNLSFGPEGVTMTVEAEGEFLESMRESKNQVFLIAVENEEVVGTGVLSGFAKPRMAHRGEIALSVKKSMWGKHIGTRLMEKLISFARERAKMEILSLEVRCDNERAIALYRKLGFEIIGTFEGMMKIQGEWIGYYLMRKEL